MEEKEDSDDKKSKSPEDKLLKIISLSATFGLIVCSIYLFAYWSSFGINILEFAGLSDFIKLGIYPVFISFGFFVLGSIIGAFYPSKKIDPKKTPEEQNKEIARDNKFYKYLRIFLLLLLAVETIIEYFRDDYGFWHTLGLLLSLFLIILVPDIKYLESIIPNRTVRLVIVSILLAAFPFAFTIGKANAKNVLSGKSVKIIDVKTIREYGSEDFAKKGLLNGQENLKFVGAAGDYFFFISMDNSVTYAIQYSELHFLELKTLNNP